MQTREQIAVGTQLLVPCWQNTKQGSAPLPIHVDLVQEIKLL